MSSFSAHFKKKVRGSMPQTPSKTALARFARLSRIHRTREITHSEKFQPFSAKSVRSTDLDLSSIASLSLIVLPGISILIKVLLSS